VNFLLPYVQKIPNNICVEWATRIAQQLRLEEPVLGGAEQSGKRAAQRK